MHYSALFCIFSFQPLYPKMGSNPFSEVVAVLSSIGLLSVIFSYCLPLSSEHYGGFCKFLSQKWGSNFDSGSFAPISLFEKKKNLKLFD